MPKKGDSYRKQQFIEWLDRQTDPEAWLTKTYQEIGEEMVKGATDAASPPGKRVPAGEPVLEIERRKVDAEGDKAVASPPTGGTAVASSPPSPVVPSVVRTVLAMSLADRLGIPPSEVIKRKAEYRNKAQGYMTPEKLELLREWRSLDPPLPIIDCAHRLDVTPQTVYNRCKELGLDAEK